MAPKAPAEPQRSERLAGLASNRGTGRAPGDRLPARLRAAGLRPVRASHLSLDKALTRQIHHVVGERLAKSVVLDLLGLRKRGSRPEGIWAREFHLYSIQEKKPARPEPAWYDGARVQWIPTDLKPFLHMALMKEFKLADRFRPTRPKARSAWKRLSAMDPAAVRAHFVAEILSGESRMARSREEDGPQSYLSAPIDAVVVSRSVARIAPNDLRKLLFWHVVFRPEGSLARLWRQHAFAFEGSPLSAGEAAASLVEGNAHQVVRWGGADGIIRFLGLDTRSTRALEAIQAIASLTNPDCVAFEYARKGPFTSLTGVHVFEAKANRGGFTLGQRRAIRIAARRPELRYYLIHLDQRGVLLPLDVPFSVWATR